MKTASIRVIFLCVGFCAVYSSVNVAFRKPAWISSGWTRSVKAGNVVDGTKYLDGFSFFQRCVHTGNEYFPRWWVNLTGDFTIARIDIDVRVDRVVRSRMNGYKLIVSDTETTQEWDHNHQIEGHICRDEDRTNPPTQQTIPCLVRGQFITYANNKRISSDRYTYLELCELEAYGCPTGWFGQGNCTEPCPDGCQDGVCNPDTGSCFTGCKSGLQGIFCDADCDNGSFGLGCQQFCFCYDDTCNPQNGTCPVDKCQRGWNGTACDQRCGYQTFGQTCEETCRCRLGSCDPVNGTCFYEGCEPGWQTESCSKECGRGTFGLDCGRTCGACRNNDPCDHVTGKCPDGCMDGWTTSFCNESCPIGSFGSNCIGKCFCKNDTCNPINGVCPGNVYDRGWKGPSRSSHPGELTQTSNYKFAAIGIGIGSGVVILALVVLVILLVRRLSRNNGNNTRTSTGMTDLSQLSRMRELQKDEPYEEIESDTIRQPTQPTTTDNKYEQLDALKREPAHIYEVA